jgi:hypothetical protein
VSDTLRLNPGGYHSATVENLGDGLIALTDQAGTTVRVRVDDLEDLERWIRAVRGVRPPGRPKRELVTDG